MSKYSNILKKALLLIVFMTMLIPMVQYKFNFIKLPPLKADVTYPEDANINKSDWFSGKYQEKQEEFLNVMFGFRSLLVRLNNQIAYSFFNKAKANGVIIGKENYLYEQGYIDAYTGTDFLGQDSIDHTLNRLKFISDTLSKLNKQLIIVFAAGKASFYPEYIPERFLPIKNKSNYKVLSDGAKKMGLNVIDFNSWFVANKHTSKYPLYPQHGVHWSTYGTVLAADSLIKMMEHLRKINAPNLYFNEVKMEQPYDVDNDIADGMNLLTKFKSFDMAYPQIKMEDTVGKTKPKVLVIADSFYWGMYNFGIANCFHQNSQFWYYNKQAYPETNKQPIFVENLNIGQELNKQEVIVIMATEATLRKISWGFIEEAEKYYKGTYVKKEKDAEYYKKIKKIIGYIKTDEKWLRDTELRAKDKHISVDSSFVLEAIWELEHPH